jgi:hypothetical protein
MTRPISSLLGGPSTPVEHPTPVETPVPAPSPLRAATQAELCRSIGIDPKTFRSWTKRPDFPRALAAPGRQRWLVADVLRWLRHDKKEVGHAG